MLGGPDQWFDPAAFVLQPQGTMGNSGRGAFRGPNLRTVDVSAVKRIPLRGNARLDLRLEVFNLFNRDNFATPTLIAFAGASADGSAAGELRADSLDRDLRAPDAARRESRSSDMERPCQA